MNDNRTDPLFAGTTMTNTVNLGITSKCTMECPNCSVAVPHHKAAGTARHAPLGMILEHAAMLRPLKRVHITGGEPTLHPDFRAIALNARQLFNAGAVTVETNGAGYVKYRDVFKAVFDRVFITHYVKDAVYSGSPDNTAVIELAEQDLGDRLIREPPVVHERGHIPLQQLGQKQTPPCSKWYDPGLPAGWYHGVLYPCCVTFGIDEGAGIEVTPDWRDRIGKMPMGCDRCCFRGT